MEPNKYFFLFYVLHTCPSENFEWIKKCIHFPWDAVRTFLAIQIKDLCFSPPYPHCHTHHMSNSFRADLWHQEGVFWRWCFKIQECCWILGAAGPPGSCKALLTLLGLGTESLEKAENSQVAELPEIKFIPDICFRHFRDIWGNLLLTFSFNLV